MASPSCAGEAGDSFESSQCSVDTSGLNATVVAADLIISDRVVAENEAALRQMEVTHIVTIDTHPLMHGNRSAGESFSNHYIEANDDLDEDLLLRFPPLFDFMKDAKRTVFHCRMGVSRSAAACMAYLMYRDKRPLADVAAQICNARKQCGPNDAFMSQLMLFEKMNFTLDSNNISFQLYCLTHMLEKKLRYRTSQKLEADEKMAFYKFLPPPGQNICCRRCRSRISSTDRIVHHRRNQKRSWFSELDSDLNDAESRRTLTNPEQVKQDEPECTRAIFVIPDEPILEQIYKVYDKINCRKCHCCVGRYNWNGLNCECGSQCLPGFLIRRSDVDIPLTL